MRYWLCSRGGTPWGRLGGALPEVTKGAALVLLLGALFTVFTLLLGKLSPEDMALEAEVVAVEKVDEDCREGVLSALACWQNKKARTCGSGGKAHACKRIWPGIWASSLKALTEGALCSALTAAAHTAGRLGHGDTSAKYQDYLKLNFMTKTLLKILTIAHALVSETRHRNSE